MAEIRDRTMLKSIRQAMRDLSNDEGPGTALDALEGWRERLMDILEVGSPLETLCAAYLYAKVQLSIMDAMKAVGCTYSKEQTERTLMEVATTRVRLTTYVQSCLSN